MEPHIVVNKGKVKVWWNSAFTCAVSSGCAVIWVWTTVPMQIWLRGYFSTGGRAFLPKANAETE